MFNFIKGLLSGVTVSKLASHEDEFSDPTSEGDYAMIALAESQQYIDINAANGANLDQFNGNEVTYQHHDFATHHHDNSNQDNWND